MLREYRILWCFSSPSCALHVLLLSAGRGLVYTQFHHVFEGFVFPKATRTYKQGESWRCPVVQLLKRMSGRAQQLRTAQGISLISVKCYCCQHRPGVNGGTCWDENYLKYREKKGKSWLLTVLWKHRWEIECSQGKWSQEICKGLRLCARCFPAAVCQLRMSKIQLLPQPWGATVRR